MMTSSTKSAAAWKDTRFVTPWEREQAAAQAHPGHDLDRDDNPMSRYQARPADTQYQEPAAGGSPASHLRQGDGHAAIPAHAEHVFLFGQHLLPAPLRHRRRTHRRVIPSRRTQGNYEHEHAPACSSGLHSLVKTDYDPDHGGWEPPCLSHDQNSEWWGWRAIASLVGLAQMVDARDLNPVCWGFDSPIRHQSAIVGSLVNVPAGIR